MPTAKLAASLLVLLALVVGAAPARAETVSCTPITALPAVNTGPGVNCVTGDLITAMTSGSASDIQAHNAGALSVSGIAPAASVASPQTQIFNSSATWTAPAGVTLVTVECWGGGGPGNGGDGKQGGGGGGGGAYSKKDVTVVPTTNYTVTVGTIPGDTWFSTPGTVLAKGGQAARGGDGGAGGAASAGIGTVKHSGGRGGNSNGFKSGAGGGGSATSSADGGAGGDATATAVGAGGTGWGWGGRGGLTGSTGGSGTVPGGGGGGGDAEDRGGNIGFGRVVLKWTAPPSTSITPSAGALSASGVAPTGCPDCSSDSR